RCQQNRFSAYDRLVRPQLNGGRTYLSGYGDLYPDWQACQSGEQASCAFYAEQMESVRSQEGKLLAKIASAFARDTAPGSQPYTHVALRMKEQLSVPWSKRDAE